MTSVFISYSHDSQEHRGKVQNLAERLRTEPGLSVVIDSDTGPGGPTEGWPLWSEQQVLIADVVLAVCTPSYRERYEGNQPLGEGLGAVCEARAIRQFLYDSAGLNSKVRAVLFDAADEHPIPNQLAPYQSFHGARDYARLVAWLTGKALSPQSAAHPVTGLNWPVADAAYAPPLADRREPFDIFEQAVTGQGAKRVLLLQGPSNTGKTALRQALLTYAKHLGLKAAAFDFKGCPSLDELLESLKLDLGSAILPQACKASGAARLYAPIADLQQLTAPVVLFIDTWEQAPDDAREWIENKFLSRINEAPAVVLVLAGQQVPEYHRSWANVAKICPLQPIKDVDDWLEFAWTCLKHPRLKREEVELLVDATRGDPGMLSALLHNLATMSSVGPAAWNGA